MTWPSTRQCCFLEPHAWNNNQRDSEAPWCWASGAGDTGRECARGHRAGGEGRLFNHSAGRRRRAIVARAQQKQPQGVSSEPWQARVTPNCPPLSSRLCCETSVHKHTSKQTQRGRWAAFEGLIRAQELGSGRGQVSLGAQRPWHALQPQGQLRPWHHRP